MNFFSTGWAITFHHLKFAVKALLLVPSDNSIKALLMTTSWVVPAIVQRWFLLATLKMFRVSELFPLNEGDSIWSVYRNSSLLLVLLSSGPGLTLTSSSSRSSLISVNFALRDSSIRLKILIFEARKPIAGATIRHCFFAIDNTDLTSSFARFHTSIKRQEHKIPKIFFFVLLDIPLRI